MRTGFLSEIGLVRIRPESSKLVDAVSSRFDMYGFSKPEAAAPTGITDIDLMNFSYNIVRSTALHPHLCGGLPVFKDGITTGTIMGLFMAIRHEYPPNWGKSGIATQPIKFKDAVPIDTLSGGKYENLLGPWRHRWLGFVKTLPGITWSQHGDSRALVYVYKGHVKVPLGFHIGKPHDFMRCSNRSNVTFSRQIPRPTISSYDLRIGSKGSEERLDAFQRFLWYSLHHFVFLSAYCCSSNVLVT
jgi:hypothetical protein